MDDKTQMILDELSTREGMHWRCYIQIKAMAKDYEGIRDLLALWHEALGTSEASEILIDILVEVLDHNQLGGEWYE